MMATEQKTWLEGTVASGGSTCSGIAGGDETTRQRKAMEERLLPMAT